MGSETAAGIAVDAAGNAYITGVTASANFPKTVGPAIHGTNDAFVTKLAPDGASVVYSTYIGGGSTEEGVAIAVDGAGDAYITGNTSSTDFPFTSAAFQKVLHGTQDTFVAELSPAGDSLVYASYLGGNNNDDYATAIAVDAAGNAYVTGRSASATNFPTTTGALQTAKCGGSNIECAYVVKVAAGGASVAYGTFLGGSDGSLGKGIAVDASGNAYVVGYVALSGTGTPFPTTTGAFQTTASAAIHGFVSKLSAAGDSLAYSTYLASNGTSAQDTVLGIAVDTAGNAYVVGNTNQNSFPKTAGAYQTMNAGQGDAFVTSCNPTGTALVYSTFLGGTGGDIGEAIAIDPRATRTSPARHSRRTFQRPAMRLSPHSRAACTPRSSRGSIPPVRCSSGVRISAAASSIRPTPSRRARRAVSTLPTTPAVHTRRPRAHFRPRSAATKTSS